MDGNIRNTNPFLKVPSAEQQQQLAQAEEKIRDAAAALDEALKVAVYTDPANASAAAGGDGNSPTPNSAAFPIRWWMMISVWHACHKHIPQRTTMDLSSKVWCKVGERVLELSSSGHFDVTVQLSLIPVTAPQNGRMEFWIRVDPKYMPEVFAIQFDDGTGNKRAVWGKSLLCATSRITLLWDLFLQQPTATGFHPLEKLTIAPGARLKSVVLSQVGGRMWLDDLRIAGDLTPSEDPLVSFNAWWKLGRTNNPAGIPEDLAKVLAGGPSGEHTADQETALRNFYLKHVQRLSDSPVADLRTQWLMTQQSKTALEEYIPGTFIFRDLEKPREAFVMLRGQYDKPGTRLSPMCRPFCLGWKLAFQPMEKLRLDPIDMTLPSGSFRSEIL